MKMSHSNEKLCISEAGNMFHCRENDLSALTMLTSTVHKEKKKREIY